MKKPFIQTANVLKIVIQQLLSSFIQLSSFSSVLINASVLLRVNNGNPSKHLVQGLSATEEEFQ